MLDLMIKTETIVTWNRFFYILCFHDCAKKFQETVHLDTLELITVNKGKRNELLFKKVSEFVKLLLV